MVFESVLFLGVVLLDPHPFGGDTSTRESLFMETPVVTLPSEQLAGRYSQVGNDSLLHIGPFHRHVLGFPSTSWP